MNAKHWLELELMDGGLHLAEGVRRMQRRTGTRKPN